MSLMTNRGDWAAFPLVRYPGSSLLVNTLAGRVYQSEAAATADVGQWTAKNFSSPDIFNDQLDAVGGDIIKLFFGRWNEPFVYKTLINPDPNQAAMHEAADTVEFARDADDYLARHPAFKASVANKQLKDQRNSAWWHWKQNGQQEVWHNYGPEQYLTNGHAGYLVGEWFDYVSHPAEFEVADSADLPLGSSETEVGLLEGEVLGIDIRRLALGVLVVGAVVWIASQNK